MNSNLFALIVIVAVVIGAVLLIRNRVKRANGPASSGRKPSGVDTHER